MKENYLFQVVNVHELSSNGAAIDLFQALNDIAQGQSFLLKVFRDKGLVLKEKREKQGQSRSGRGICGGGHKVCELEV